MCRDTTAADDDEDEVADGDGDGGRRCRSADVSFVKQ